MYENKKTVDYSLSDFNGCLSIKSIMEVAQNQASGYFGTLGCDNLTLRKYHHAMWVFVKYKVYMKGKVIWGKNFYADTYITSIKKLKCLVQTDFKDENGNIFANTILESCLLDTETFGLRRLDTIPFPMDLKTKEGIPFTFIGREKEGFFPVYNHLVRSQDIDFSHHVNNICYITYCLNSYSVEELSHMKITSLEIYFLKQAKEGDLLHILRKKESHKDIFSIQEEEEVFQMSIEYEEV